MFDFHSTFLNSYLDVDEDIYMEQPPNHAAADPDHYVVKLYKSIYGLKQAGKKWYDSLSRSLADIGFQKSEADPAIFYAHVGDEVVILAIHVDDCTIMGSSETLQNDFKAHIRDKFKLNDLGPILWLLGFASLTIKLHALSPFCNVSILRQSSTDSTLRTANLSQCPWIQTHNCPRTRAQLW